MGIVLRPIHFKHVGVYYVMTIILFFLSRSDTFDDPIKISWSDEGNVEAGDNMNEEPQTKMKLNTRVILLLQITLNDASCKATCELANM